MQKQLPSPPPPAVKRIMDLFDNLIQQGHMLRFAEENPRDFYRFTARVIPYYMQYVSQTTPNPVRQRSFVRLSDGTEIDF